MEKKNPDLDIEKIIQDYRPIINFRVKKAIGQHTPEWEDVVNEIIVNVIEKLQNNEFRGDSSIGTFIYTITSRRIVDYIRKKSKVLKHIPQPNPFPDPYEQVETREKAELMENAIKELKPKYKKVLYLYYYKGLSRKEVAQKMNITPSQVSERVNYAQKLVQKKIKK
ncbi:sigma-70 family RNA polymerase sigma factor [bacterium]|nr:sigma-70 family RNA polymerase sigma factor [bacterium]